MTTDNPILLFKADYADWETESKGYSNVVFVKTPDGKLYEVFFYDPVRLSQDLGNGVYIANPGLIILNLVNKASMQIAVNELWEKGFFNYFNPVSSLDQKHFEETV